MGIITCEKNRVVYQRRNEMTVFEPYGDNCFRVRFTKNGRFSEEKWTLQEPVKEVQCVIKDNGNTATITNGHLSVHIDAGNYWFGGIFTFYKDGKVILKNKFEGDYDIRTIHKGGDNYQYKVIFEANENEHFYGLGQECEDIFDRKGSTCNIMHYNTKSAIPVLYSSLGYGFLWNCPSPGRVETTRNHTMWVADSAYQADFLVYTGDTPAEVMHKYCELTGFAPKFPRWAAGFWQSKLRYESQDEVLAAAREYKERGIPIAAIVIDFFHWTEQGDWKFDPALWPDPAALSKELKEMGIQPIVSVWPTVNENSENYQYLADRNYLVRTESGLHNTFNFCGHNTFLDATHPDARKFMWSKIKQNYYDLGFHNFWLDEAEPEIHPQMYSNFKFYLGNGDQTALLYPYYYNKLFYEGLKEAGEDEVILLTRAGYTGVQKYGALVWNGDIESSFRNLSCSVKTGLSMAMSGIPWWNSDIGGFMGGDTESDYFRELIVRWMQFGVFCPVMRIHGDRKHESTYVERHPGVKCPSGGNNEIWCFGERNYEIIKDLINLRERLKPYILKHMDIASTEGKPIMRPMFFDHYNDPVCYELEDQYMFGEDILFAPIVNQGQTERKVYLPAGKWIDVNTKEIIEGGKWIDACAPIVNQGQTERKVYLPAGKWIDVNTKEIIEGGKWIDACAPIEKFIAYVKEGSEVIKAFTS